MAQQSDRKVPEIRFRGFAEEWTEKPLGSFGHVAMNRRIFKHQTSEAGDIPFFKIGSFGGEPDAFISRQLFEEYKRRYQYPGEGDLLISAAGSIGKVVEYEGHDEYFQDSNIVWLDHGNKISNPFLKQFYQFVKWSGLEGSTIKRLYNKNILETNITLPSFDEQEQIGEYFKSLDRMIGLHQRKHDKLLTLKQAMLRKMFPQDGATTPKIRFKGFEGEWATKAVGQLATFSKGQGYSKKDLRKDGTPIILYGRLYTAYETEISSVDTFADEQSGSVKSDGNEVIVPSSGETAEDIARASAVVQAGVILGGDLNVITPCDDLDPCFLALTLSHGKPQKELARKAQGKSVVHVRNSDIEPLEIPIPELTEQQKIGGYFRNVDILISKHATQLSKLKNIKSACLEKMFV